MKLNDIKLIESKTGISLPQHYIDLVTNYPIELAGTDAPQFGLLDDPEEIIFENLDVRANGYFGEIWPAQYFIIGKTGCGDYYVIKHEASEFSVGFSDHEIMACNKFADSRQDFIQKLLLEMSQP